MKYEVGDVVKIDYEGKVQNFKLTRFIGAVFEAKGTTTGAEIVAYPENIIGLAEK